MAGKTHKIDGNSLDRYLKNTKWREKGGLLGLMDLARWSIRQSDASRVNLSEPPAGKVPKLTDELFQPGQLEKAVRQFEEVGRRLAVQVPLTIQKKNSKYLLHTGFMVFVERDGNLEKAEDHFIRQGITIPEVSSLKHKGIRAIISVEDPILSAFLGDAENPAHTEWERNSKKFKMKYIRGPRTLDFVKTSPRELVKLLTQPKKGRDENLLKHLFALPAVPDELPVKGEDKKKKGSGDEKENNGVFIGVEGSNYLQLSPIKGGFRLMRRAKATRIPRFIEVRIAYEVRGGNPFKKYTPLDFDIGQKPVEINLEDCKSLFYKENRIFIEVMSGDFKLAITGFDPHRDLRVKTIP